MDLVQMVVYLVLLVLSVSLHEAAHGYAAYAFGDPTAKEQGRLTLNPIKHIDLFSSIIMPGTLFVASQGQMIFGGAKPVPFNPARFRPGTSLRKAVFSVAAAGPLVNFILAFIGLLGATLLRKMSGYGVTGSLPYQALNGLYTINLLLGTFNMLPIPPLDGAKIIGSLFPIKVAIFIYNLERYAMPFIILIILIVFFAAPVLLVPLETLDGIFRDLVKALVW